VDHAGRLWVGTREGLAVHDRGQWSTIGLREGLPSPNIWPLLLHDDVLYIGMSNAGVAELNLRHLEGRAPWIRFNDPVDRGDMITLAWQAYGTPGTPFGGDIPTRYRLDDDAWSAWGKTAMLELRNVAVGEHTITVQARGPLAQVDPAGTSLRFTVPPPFYLRPLFLLSVGALTGLFLFLGYITLLRRAQHSRELRERDARYRVMAEATGQLIYDLDVRTGKISWQGAVQAVTGYTKEEFSGADLDRWRTLLHPDDREHVEAVFRMALSNRSSVQMEFRLRKKDGEFVDLFANGFVLQSPAHEPERVLGTLTDISARKQGEMQIAASLKEKEVLLKEIHHRVKNNLQVISSLLSLQSGASADNHAREQLRESQNRIRSMALIHERLYQSENLAQVDLGEYVQSLIAYLFRSYSVPNVRVIYSIDRCSLPVNTAIPCGLMINELVSNALKYAFKGRPEGEIEIGFSLLEGNRGVLMVRDDGVGFPPGLDHRATPTLGLQLVNTLTSQINGTLELVPGRGTTFTITLPLEE
jgi:PAS domain S-box-containing protein